MCKNGKCQERAGQTRNVIISMGTTARELSKLANHPHMVVKADTHIAFVGADPALHGMPGISVIMEVCPTTNDAEIVQKTEAYLDDVRRSPPLPSSLIQMLEQLLGMTDETSRLAPRAREEITY